MERILLMIFGIILTGFALNDYSFRKEISRKLNKSKILSRMRKNK